MYNVHYEQWRVSTQVFTQNISQRLESLNFCLFLFIYSGFTIFSSKIRSDLKRDQDEIADRELSSA